MIVGIGEEAQLTTQMAGGPVELRWRCSRDHKAMARRARSGQGGEAA